MAKIITLPWMDIIREWANSDDKISKPHDRLIVMLNKLITHGIREEQRLNIEYSGRVK